MSSSVQDIEPGNLVMAMMMIMVVVVVVMMMMVVVVVDPDPCYCKNGYSVQSVHNSPSVLPRIHVIAKMGTQFRVKQNKRISTLRGLHRTRH